MNLICSKYESSKFIGQNQDAMRAGLPERSVGPCNVYTNQSGQVLIQNLFSAAHSTRVPSKIEHYQIGKTLGKGNFARVKFGVHEIAKATVAIKIVDKNKVSSENMTKIRREIEILKTLKHPHIIKIYQVLDTEQFLFIVTEFAGGGEIFTDIMRNGRKPEEEARKLFRQIVAAVGYCHTVGVVHRDIKTENLLLDSDGKIKLIDFGFSNFFETGNLLSTWCGSPPYAAPELFLGHEYDGAKADVWSLGVILFILVSGGFPFPSTTFEEMKAVVLSGVLTIPFRVSPDCADLIRKMLNVNPEKRFTVRQVAQHRWFTEGMVAEEEALMQASFCSLSSDSMDVDVASLDRRVLEYMEEKGRDLGWNVQAITESLIRKRFDAMYATYHLLMGRINTPPPPVPVQFLSQLPPAPSEQPRRSSRGSITTGIAYQEPPIDPNKIPIDDPSISTYLNEDLDTENSEEENEAAGSTIPDLKGLEDRNMKFQEGFAQLKTFSRRHTGVQLTSIPLLPFFSFNGVDPNIPYPLQPSYLHGFPLGNVSPNRAQLSLLGGLLGHSHHGYFSPDFPAAHLSFPQDPGGLRRSSDSAHVSSDNRFPPAGGLLSQLSSSSQGQSAPSDEPMSVEDSRMAANYLKLRGAGKRHTIHAEAQIASRQHSNFPSSGSLGGGILQGKPRLSAGCPYRHSAGSRRSSDTTAVANDIARLESMYSQAIKASQKGMPELQREFQQLKASTAAQGEHDFHALRMISEHQAESGGSLTAGTSGAKLSGPAARGSLTSGTPKISVTDERGGSTLVHRSMPSLPFTDNLQMLQQQALGSAPGPLFPQRSYYYHQTVPSNLFSLGEQSSLDTQSGDENESGSSKGKTDEMDWRKEGYKSYASSLGAAYVAQKLKTFLDNMKIRYLEDTVGRCDEPKSAERDEDSDSGNSSRRLSVESDDGTRVEIGIYPSHGGDCKSKVDFRYLAGNSHHYDQICTQLLSVLR